MWVLILFIWFGIFIPINIVMLLIARTYTKPKTTKNVMNVNKIKKARRKIKKMENRTMENRKSVLDVINPKKVIHKMEEQDKKERELNTQRFYDESIRIVLSMKSLSTIDPNIMLLTATRHDGVVHQIVYNRKYFQTFALRKARRKLIKEVELLTGRVAIIVLSHEEKI